jgi:hypothetical protein
MLLERSRAGFFATQLADLALELGLDLLPLYAVLATRFDERVVGRNESVIA